MLYLVVMIHKDLSHSKDVYLFSSANVIAVPDGVFQERNKMVESFCQLHQDYRTREQLKNLDIKFASKYFHKFRPKQTFQSDYSDSMQGRIQDFPLGGANPR